MRRLKKVFLWILGLLVLLFAATNYEKSLALNPRNPNAREVVARIRAAKPAN